MFVMMRVLRKPLTNCEQSIAITHTAMESTLPRAVMMPREKVGRVGMQRAATATANMYLVQVARGADAAAAHGVDDLQTIEPRVGAFCWLTRRSAHRRCSVAPGRSRCHDVAAVKLGGQDSEVARLRTLGPIECATCGRAVDAPRPGL